MAKDKLKLSKDSTRRDITLFINEFNKSDEFSMSEVEELLINLVNLEIDTYNFSMGANAATRTINKKIIPVLEKYLKHFDQNAEKKVEDYDKAFVAYYLLTYYYRTYEKLDKFSNVINLYQSYFESHNEKYALAYQIKARYLRRKGNRRDALAYDRKAGDVLTKKNINNIQVRVTYASTVSMSLENREPFVTERDIEDAYKTAEEAIILNSDYPKYRYLLGKLIIFTLLYKNSHNQLEGIDYSSEILRAKESLREAIELEDSTSDSYPISVIEYRTYMRAADLVLAEIRLTENMRLLEQKQTESIQHKFEQEKKDTEGNLLSTKNEIIEELKTAKSGFEAQLKQTQDRYMEILGLIVSIVAIIMVVIGTYSANLSITAILVATFGMCIGMIAVYSALLILLKEPKVKYFVFLVVSSIAEILIIIVSILWPVIRKWM